MRTLSALALLLAVAGCSSAADAPGNFTTPTPEADAGHDVIVPPTPGTDAAPKVDGGAEGGQAADAQREADATPAIDSGAIDSGVPTTDAGTSPEATPPTVDAAPPGNDAMPPRVDAGTDAPFSNDAAPTDVDAGNDAGVFPICPALDNPKCQAANDTDARIRATFTKPCSTTVGYRMCGGVNGPPPDDYVTETLPMLCFNGQWRLGGSWSGSQWVASHNCSTGCAAGQLCDP